MRRTLLRRVLKMLQDSAEKDPERYDHFWTKFGHFLKEGVCTDAPSRFVLSHLLRFESSSTAPGEWTSFEAYKSRMLPQQKKIYVLHSPSRELALASPYYEVCCGVRTCVCVCVCVCVCF